MMENSFPYTERSNEITENIDICNGAEIVQLLQKTDIQVFKGINSKNLYHETTVEAIADVASLIRTTLVEYDAKDVAIVLSGCGTSGRLAFLAARIANDLLLKVGSSNPFCYSIAGGDMSILTSQEAPEDDAEAGKEDLIKLCQGKRKVIFIGITCGISAAFVAGQLEYCMKHLEIYTPVLIGFNPVSMARDVKMKNWARTVREVALDVEKLAAGGKAFVINPVLGAEAITGSSRMKGGTATKIILEVIILSVANGFGLEEPISPEQITTLFRVYAETFSEFYEINSSEVIGKLIEKCGNSLKAQGKVRYLSSGWGGVLALIDSTECPPTFGSSVNDIRGFVLDGYDSLQIEDFGRKNEFFKLGLEDLLEMYNSTTEKSKDTVIVFLQSTQDPLLEKLTAKVTYFRKMNDVVDVVAVIMEDPMSATIDVTEIQTCFSEVCRVKYPSCKELDRIKWEGESKSALIFSLRTSCFKLLLNAISTGAHVLLGKIYKNYMCNVQVSNSKLYHRVIDLIQRLCDDVNEEKAKACLLKSIYEVDSIDDEINSLTVSQHNQKASRMDKVVPLALIMARTDCPVDVAKGILKSNPVVRTAILSAKMKTNLFHSSTSDMEKKI